MKKIITFLAFLILVTSCAKEDNLVCGVVVDEWIEVDGYGYEYYYIELETDYGNYTEFEVTRRAFFSTYLGDYTCYE